MTQQDLNQLSKSYYCAGGVCGALALALLHPPPLPQLLNHPRLVTSSSVVPATPLASTRTLPPTFGISTASNPSSNCGARGSKPSLDDHRLESSASARGGDGNVAGATLLGEDVGRGAGWDGGRTSSLCCAAASSRYFIYSTNFRFWASMYESFSSRGRFGSWKLEIMVEGERSGVGSGEPVVVGVGGGAVNGER